MDPAQDLQKKARNKTQQQIGSAGSSSGSVRTDVFDQLGNDGLRATVEEQRQVVAPEEEPPSLLAAIEEAAPEQQVAPAIAEERPEQAALAAVVASPEEAKKPEVVEEVAPVGFADLDGDGVYRLGCVGDSNTSLVSGLKKWCEIIRDGVSDPDFAVINVAVNGATVNPNLRFTSDATMQMAEVLSQAPDLLVLAFGTNDVFQGRTPQQIHDAYLAQQPTADAAGVPFYVATTPPIIGCPNCTPGIEQGNDMLRATFAGRVVEFYTGFGADEFNPDHYHLNSVEQQLRAERALEVLGR